MIPMIRKISLALAAVTASGWVCAQHPQQPARTPFRTPQEAVRYYENLVGRLSQQVRSMQDENAMLAASNAELKQRVDRLEAEMRSLAGDVAGLRKQIAADAPVRKAQLNQLPMIQETQIQEKSVVRAKTGMMTRTVSQECDVRGMSLEEALGAVELYLDEAVLAGLNEVYIIHGKGTGILRSGIQQDLRKNRHVKSFRRGVYSEGEDGVTVVTLR